MTFGLCLVFPCSARLCFTAFPSFGWCDVNPVLAVWRKDPVEASEVDSGFWHQGGQPGNEVNWFKYHMGSAITVGRLELIAHLAGGRQGKAFYCNGGPGDVATQPLQLFTLMAVGSHPGMQAEAIEFGHSGVVLRGAEG